MFAILTIAVGSGFVLGLRHALDADHIVAVSSMVKRRASWWETARVGLYWGIGHATTLLVVGMGLLLLDLSISGVLEAGFEGIVGVLLVLLGIRALRAPVDHKHDHQALTSAGVGAIHGLAGSAALLLLVLATVESSSGALIYIGAFSIGNVTGMWLFTLVLSLPFQFSGDRSVRFIQRVAGLLSIALGLLLLVELMEVLLG